MGHPILLVKMWKVLIEKGGYEALKVQPHPHRPCRLSSRAKTRTSGTTSSRANNFWVSKLTLDTSSYSQGNRGTLWYNLSSCSCLENLAFFRLELPKARAACTRTEPRGSKFMAAGKVAVYKKTPEKKTEVSSSLMKAVLCCNHSSDALEHLKDKLLSSMSLSVMSGCRLLPPLASLPRETNSIFSFLSMNTILLLKMSLVFCGALENLSLVRLPSSWINGVSIEQNCLKNFLKNIRRISVLNGCPVMPQSLTLLRESGAIINIVSLQIWYLKAWLSLIVRLEVLLTISKLNCISFVPFLKKQNWPCNKSRITKKYAPEENSGLLVVKESIITELKDIREAVIFLFFSKSSQEDYRDVNHPKSPFWLISTAKIHFLSIIYPIIYTLHYLSF